MVAATPPLAIKDDPNQGMQIQEIPVADIFADPEFNIRGSIPPGTVIDLARNIETNGLLQPITVQPFNKEVNGHFYKYRVVVGHRRHLAYEIKEWPRIPCVVKEGLNDLDAFTLNFIENINREQLNILQEAMGVKKFKDAGLTIEETSKRINQSKGWIQIRFALLDLPIQLQKEAAAGFITQSQIRDLKSLEDPDKQFEAFRKIRDAQINGEKRALKIREEKPRDPHKAKARDKSEIEDMVGHMLDTVGPQIGSRALAWAAGNINDLEMYREIRKFADEYGLEYNPPDHIKPYFENEKEMVED